MAKKIKKDLKIFQKIKALNNEDVKKLSKYLQRPIGKKSSRSLALFEYLKKKLPTAKVFPSYEVLYFKAFPEAKSYNKQRIVETISDLSKLIDEFFAVDELFRDSDLQLLLKAKAKKRRSLKRAFFNDIERLERINKQREIKNEEYHEKARFFNHEMYFAPDTNILRRESSYYLGEAIASLETRYVILRLKYGCEQYVLRLIRREPLEDDTMDYLLSIIDKPILQTEPAVQFYGLTALEYKEGTRESYYIYKDRISKYIDLLSAEDQLAVFVHLINLASFRVERKTSLLEYYSIYKEGLERKVYIQSSHFDPAYFNNIFHVFFQLGKKMEAKQFIDQYSKFLPETSQEKENINQLYTAYLHFENQEYKSVIQALQLIQFRDFSYGLRAHVLALKATYEYNKEPNVLIPEIGEKVKAYKGFLARCLKAKHFSADVHQKNMTFASYIVRLNRCMWNKKSKSNYKNT